LSYTPAKGIKKVGNPLPRVNGEVDRQQMIRAADAKEVGVGNPAEETYRYPNHT